MANIPRNRTKTKNLIADLMQDITRRNRVSRLTSTSNKQDVSALNRINRSQNPR